jgi:acyl-CoA carboxylase subunit beta
MTETVPIVKPRRPADDVDWMLCAGCRTHVYGRRWRRDLLVCPECGRHAPVGAPVRLEQLLDPGSLLELPTPTVPEAGEFRDVRSYHDRLAEARALTGLLDAATSARGTIGGFPLVVAVMEFAFLGGSMGAMVGEMITLAAEAALRDRVPFLIVTTSGGARMQEGPISLMQMAKTSAALAELSEAGILSISLISDPTFGGVAASFATLPDVIIAEPGARLGFAGRRVIEQTIRQELPAGFQTAEHLFENGFLDMIVPRRELRKEIGQLLRVANTASQARDDGGTRGGLGSASRAPDWVEASSPWARDEELAVTMPALVRDPQQLGDADAWDLVRGARALDRPTSLDYIAMVFREFQELHGDRISGDCPAIVGGTAWLDDLPVVVIGQQKGHTPAELTRRNFGMPLPAGYRKAARLMSLAAKLRLPVVTLVDTPGAYPGAQAEEEGQAAAIARNLSLMTSLPVPVVTVVTGEGGSGGALGLAVANRVLMFSGSVYSVISPEGCAAILWHDPAAAPSAAAALGLTSGRLLETGVVDAVLPEPDGGTGADPFLAAEHLRVGLTAALDELAGLTAEQLVRDRRSRFRRFGCPAPAVGAEAAL